MSARFASASDSIAPASACTSPAPETMKTIGEPLQQRTWESLVERMVEESGGSAAKGIEHTEEDLSEDQGIRIEDWIRDLVMERKRKGSH